MEKRAVDRELHIGAVVWTFIGRVVASRSFDIGEASIKAVAAAAAHGIVVITSSATLATLRHLRNALARISGFTTALRARVGRQQCSRASHYVFTSRAILYRNHSPPQQAS